MSAFARLHTGITSEWVAYRGVCRVRGHSRTLAQPEVRTPDPARLADTGDLCEPQEWPRGASTDGQRRHRGGIARCRYLFFRRTGPRTRRASHDRRRLVRARHWTARPARRDRHDAYAGRPRPDRTIAISRAACGRRSPERPGERSGLPACHVRRGRPRRYARPAPQTRRAARRRSGPVRRRVSALLRPRPRGHSHRAGRANRLTPDTRSGVIRERWRSRGHGFDVERRLALRPRRSNVQTTPLVSPPVALAIDVFARILAEVGRADDEDLEALRPGLVASPRAGRDAHRVPFFELDDLVVDFHPPAPAQDHVHLLLLHVRVAVRKAIAGRDALVAQGGFLELERLGRRAELQVRRAVEPRADVLQILLDVAERERHGAILWRHPSDHLRDAIDAVSAYLRAEQDDEGSLGSRED